MKLENLERRAMQRLAIDSGYLVETLKSLLQISSPTGFTDNIVRHVSRELSRLGLEAELTRRGAIRAIRNGARSDGARAIVSHLDTLGAQVKYIRDTGRLSLVPIGTWSARFAGSGPPVRQAMSRASCHVRISIESPAHPWTDKSPASRFKKSVDSAGSVQSNDVLPILCGPKITPFVDRGAAARSSAVMILNAIFVTPG